MFLSLWNYLRGYVIVEVKGYALEKFMNLILHHHIRIWDAHYKNGKLYFKTRIDNFKRLKPYAKKSKSHLCIVKKKGLPFLCFRYRKRSVLVLGVLIFVMGLYSLSSFVWLVEVTGNKNLQDIDIIQCLDEAGYRTGKLKGKMNLRQAEHILVNAYSEIVWAGIEFKGTKMLVQIAETVPKPKMCEDTFACNLIAKRDALITYIATDKGMPMVKRGDTVTRGSVLVSGQMKLEDEQGTLYYTHSEAKIKAKTGYTLQARLPLTKIQKIYTNRVSKKWHMRIFDHKFSLWNQKASYEKYDTLITSHQLKLTRLFPLPFYLEKEERVEYIPHNEEINKVLAKDILEGALHDYLRAHISKDAQILKQEIHYTKSQNELIAIFNVIVEEDITEVQAIN